MICAALPAVTGCPGLADAQAPATPRPLSEMLLQSWTDEQGLPSNSIQHVAQSADGYVWAATEEGLVRFDGLRFTTFRRRALPSVNVRVLLPMPDSSLWVGLEGGGLVRHLRGRFTTIGTREGLPSNQVVAIAPARDGGLWVGTGGGGLAHVGAGSGDGIRVYGRAHGLPHDHVNAVLEDADGRSTWIGTAGGLARLRDGRIEPVPGEVAGVRSRPGALDSRAVTALVRLRGGDIAVGTLSGLAMLRDGVLREGHAALAGVHIRSLMEDSRGSLWVGTHGDGVVRLAGGTVSSMGPSSGLPGGLVRALHEDRTGAVWIATTGGGLHRLRDPLVAMYGVPEGLPGDVALALMQDRDGSMLVGTAGSGLARIRNGRVEPVATTAQGLTHDVILSLAQDRDGALWIGTPRGLNRLHRGAIETFDAADGIAGAAILVTFIDSRGALWLGTNGDGLQRWRPGPPLTLTVESGLPSDVVNAIVETAPGAFWVATREGIAKVKDGRVEPGSVMLEGRDVLALHLDPAGALWIGLAEGGFGRLKSGRLELLTEEDGLADNGVYALIEGTRGGLWVSGPRGVSRFEKREVERYLDTGRRSPLQPRVYGPADGMRTREANGGVFPAAWRTADGRMWFPTVRGAAVFDPRASAAPPRPIVILERLVAGDAEVALTDTARVPAGTHTLRFAYTAIAFEQPAQVRFRYQLVGFDTLWTEAGTTREARYTSVPPGTYAFRVAAARPNGQWQEAAVAVPVIVGAHYYQTALFRVVAGLLAAAVLLAALVALHRWRLRKLRHRERELVGLVADRTRAEARYRELFENASDAVFTTDIEGRLVSVNRRFTELSGHPPAALIGRPIGDFLTAAGEGDADATGARWREPRAAAPMTLVRADGSHAALEVSTRVIDDGDGAGGIQAIARDVTARLGLEQRMLQTQRMEALGQLAGGVAHDFNNVLVAITGYSELLLDELADDAPARADVNEIQQAAHRATRLTRQLLAFSRQQVMDTRVLDLNAIITELRSMLQRLVREDIGISYALDPATSAVEADQGQLEQVMLNLVVNARDAMPTGGRITVQTESIVVGDDGVVASSGTTIPPGRYARLSVTDTGSGIPREVQARMFEPFFTTKELGHGTGLGLATVLGIVQQSNGFVTCESTVGEGTTFGIYLPSADQPPADTTGAHAAVRMPAGGATILVVEDDETVRSTTRRLLERSGYTVLEAVDGAHALEVSTGSAVRIDVVVTDMIMPVMNGYELAERIRHALPDTRIILVSGYTKDSVIRRDMLSAVDGFVEKPFTSGVLVSKIREVMGARRATADLHRLSIRGGIRSCSAPAGTPPTHGIPMINAGDRTSDPDAFLAVLSTRFDRDTLDAHPASVVGLLPDMRIAWVNKAWRGFASANEGQPAIDERWGIGANYLDAVPAPLRAFYERLLARVPDDGAAMHPVSHAYECSSPETFRKFNMQVYGLPNRAGYVIINSLVSESPHPDSGSAAGAHPALESRYRGSNGVIVQCAHCRRVRHGRESARWDWVPDWVRQMPRETSHGLCPVCANYYYPDDGG